MIIIGPNKLAAKIRDRMQVLLSPDQFEPSLLGKDVGALLPPTSCLLLPLRALDGRVETASDVGDKILARYLMRVRHP